MHNAQFLALALIACEGTQIFLNCTKLGVRFFRVAGRHSYIGISLRTIIHENRD